MDKIRAKAIIDSIEGLDAAEAAVNKARTALAECELAHARCRDNKARYGHHLSTMKAWAESNEDFILFRSHPTQSWSRTKPSFVKSYEYKLIQKPQEIHVFNIHEDGSVSAYTPDSSYFATHETRYETVKPRRFVEVLEE